MYALIFCSLPGRQELEPVALRCYIYMVLSSVTNFRLEMVT